MPPITNHETSKTQDSVSPSASFKGRPVYSGRTGLGRLLHFAYSRLDLILTIALGALLWREVMRPAAAGPPVLPPLAYLDYSWFLEMAFKAHHGILFGRDVVFSYGPLYQWLWSLPSRAQGFSLGSFFATHDLFQYGMILALIYGATAFLLHGYAPWKRAFYILMMFAFWPPEQVRASFLLFVVACVIYQVQRTIEGETVPIVRAAVTSMVVVGSFLISPDCGTYACAIFAIAVVVNLWFLRANMNKIRRMAWFLSLSAISAAVWVLLINNFMRAPFYFGFWRDEFALVSMYRWTMGLGMNRQMYHRFFAFIVFGICTFIFAWVRRRPGSRELLQNPASLLAAFLCCLLILQSGAIRADWGHIMLGASPLITLGFAVLMGSANQENYKWTGDLPVLLAVILTGVFSGPSWYLQPHTMASAFKPLGKTVCPADRIEFDHACVVQQDYARLAPVADYLTKHTSQQDRILTFPYENIYGDVTRRMVSGGTLQLNAAAGPYLTKRNLEGIEADNPPTAIYSVDNLAETIGGVPNFTRAPELWFYLQSHYQQETEIVPGIIALRSSQERQRRWNMRTTPLALNPLAQTIRLNKDLVVASSLRWPADADFLRLRVTVQYPFWWKLSKPSNALIELRRGDGSYVAIPVLIPPNTPSEIWVFPWDEQQLARYFAPGAETWRTSDRAPITEVRLRFEPMDFLSVAPSKVVVDNLSIASVTLN